MSSLRYFHLITTRGVEKTWKIPEFSMFHPIPEISAEVPPAHSTFVIILHMWAKFQAPSCHIRWNSAANSHRLLNSGKIRPESLELSPGLPGESSKIWARVTEFQELGSDPGAGREKAIFQMEQLSWANALSEFEGISSNRAGEIK